MSMEIDSQFQISFQSFIPLDLFHGHRPAATQAIYIIAAGACRIIGAYRLI